MKREKKNESDSLHVPDERSLSRRDFLKNMALISSASIVGSNLIAGCLPMDASDTIVKAAGLPAKTAPPPEVKITGTLMKALQKRRSTNGFYTKEIPEELLLSLLWAAWGINRPDSGKRTAPSAMNTQEMDLYVVRKDGAYFYDAIANVLNPSLRKTCVKRPAG